MAAIGHGGRGGAEGIVPGAAHVAQANVARPDRGAIRAEELAEDLELIVGEPAAIVVARPDDDKAVVGGVVGHRGIVGVVGRVAGAPHRR